MKTKALIFAIAAALLWVPVQAQEGPEEPISVDAFTKLLADKLGESAMVFSAEIYATDGQGFIYLPFGAANIYSTAPAAEPPCGGADFIEQVVVNNYKYIWCYSHRVNFEGRRDIYVSSGGSPFQYIVTSHYDCQIAADRHAMPTVTKVAVC